MNLRIVEFQILKSHTPGSWMYIIISDNHAIRRVE